MNECQPVISKPNVRPGRSPFVLLLRSMANRLRTFYILKIKYPWVKHQGGMLRIKLDTELWSPHRDITLGDRVQFGKGCAVICDAEFGHSVLCANFVRFVGKDDHLFHIPGTPIWDSGRGDHYKTRVGNDVWIGEHVVVVGGVTIGDGSIVAAGSVVTKDIPPCEIWCGNPAKKIRDRFPDSVAKEHHLSIIRRKLILKLEQ